MPRLRFSKAQKREGGKHFPGMMLAGVSRLPINFPSKIPLGGKEALKFLMIFGMRRDAREVDGSLQTSLVRGLPPSSLSLINVASLREAKVIKGKWNPEELGNLRCPWLHIIYISVILSAYVMTVITVRIDEETKRMMERVRINWSEFIRSAIRNKIMEERRRNLAKAVLITERVRKRSRGEAKAEEIVRRFRDERGGSA